MLRPIGLALRWRSAQPVLFLMLAHHLRFRAAALTLRAGSRFAASAADSHRRTVAADSVSSDVYDWF
jgi:hypothetical protein